MARTNAADLKMAKQLAGMDPFHREQYIAKRIYEQLICHLDRGARRRVLGIINDYALQVERDRRNRPDPPIDFKLEDE